MFYNGIYYLYGLNSFIGAHTELFFECDDEELTYFVMIPLNKNWIAKTLINLQNNKLL